jgi:ATP-dependent RNA helicase DeaD
MQSFHDFHLHSAMQAILTKMEIKEPTPIQAEAIPALLAGKDVVGQSATGSGKTLAYGIPLVERLARNKRVVQALILVPTRELAMQVNTVISKLAASKRLTTALLVGGRAYGPQISALRYGSQIVVGTPGRVQDHLDRGTLAVDNLSFCVLDEADQMLDSGFAPAIEEILATTPETRQLALFSATIPAWVVELQQKFLKDPINITITPEIGGQSTIEQIAYQVPRNQKIAALCALLQSSEGGSSLIFGKTKFGVERLGNQLNKLGFVVGTLHGDKSQRAREDVLSAFRQGHIQTLLATNVAARGLDIQGIYQVINYELPESSELFTHRVGRTGRMGRQGKAITLLTPSDISKWRRMTRSLGQTVSLQQFAMDALLTAIPHILPEIAEIQEIPVEEQEALQPRQRRRSPIQGQEQPAVTQEKQPSRQRRRSPVQEQEQPVVAAQPRQRRRSPIQEQESPIPVRRSKSFTPGRNHSRRTQLIADHSAPISLKKRRNEHADSEIAAWQPEGFPFPERRTSGKEKDGRRRGSEQPAFNKAGKRKVRTLPAPGPKQRSTRRMETKPVSRAKRSFAPKRAASR